MFKKKNNNPQTAASEPQWKVTAWTEAAFTLATRGQNQTEIEAQAEDTCLILKDVKEISRAQGKPGGSPQKANNQKMTPTIPRVKIKQMCKACHIVLEFTVATHSSTLAWKIPWTEEPGRLQSMG